MLFYPARRPFFGGEMTVIFGLFCFHRGKLNFNNGQTFLGFGFFIAGVMPRPCCPMTVTFLVILFSLIKICKFLNDGQTLLVFVCLSRKQYHLRVIE
jgi:hypothetical protein